jgi:hypothetical protein
MFIFSIIFTCFLLEIGLRVAFDALPNNAQAVLQHVRRVPWSQTRLLPPFPYIISREHQAIVAPNHYDYPVRWGDARFSFNTQALWGMPVGFRTEQPRWPVQIVALGDSFTFCWVAFEDCWVQRLAQETGWSVMNLGIPGTGTRAHLSLLEPYVKPLEPQVVVWQWFGNDFMDDYQIDRLQDLTAPLPEPRQPPPVPDYGPLAEYSAVYRLVRHWLDGNPDPQQDAGQVLSVNGRSVYFTHDLGANDFSIPAVTYGWGRTVSALAEAENTFASWGVVWVLVLIPTKEEVYAPLLPQVFTPEHLAVLSEGRVRMLDLCQRKNWFCLDLTTTFQSVVAEGGTVYHAFDFHLDPQGNALLAEELAAYLQAKGLLSAP